MQEASSDIADIREEEEAAVDALNRGENIFGTTGTATDYFPAKSYRKHQRETIERVEAAFESGYQFVLLDAPTGSGKSLIGISLAKQANDSFYLTIQKILQDQIEMEFPDIFVLKGRNAYTCLRSGKGEQLSCADGPCRRKTVEPCHEMVKGEDGVEHKEYTCPYRVAKTKALEAPITCLNFDSFFWNNLRGGFSGRTLLIIDEAHNIGQKYSAFMGFTIRSDEDIEVPKYDTLSEYDDFIQKLFPVYEHELEVMEEWKKYDGLSKKQLSRYDDLSRLISKLEAYRADRLRDTPVEYVFDYKPQEGRFGSSVKFRPVLVGDFTKRMLFPYGERCLMMSATILDKEMFCKDVGLDPEEVCYIEVPCAFPPENRPIVRKYVGLMSMKHIDKNLPKLVEEIQRIVDKFPTRKGIIQTHSDKIADYLQANLPVGRFTYNTDYATPQVMMMVHRTKPGSFIVASGLREGLDLRGDLSKVQIICKVPYPYLGDKKVKRRMEIDENWYGWQTSLMFVQILGRSVRSEKEKAVTYLLDSSFGYFYNRNKHFIPLYVKEGILWDRK
jgi:Rad3-related DNA helicase